MKLYNAYLKQLRLEVSSWPIYEKERAGRAGARFPIST